MLPTKTHPACTIHENKMLLSLWLDNKKKMVAYTKISRQVVRLRDKAGNAEEEGEEFVFLCKRQGKGDIGRQETGDTQSV